MVAALSATDIVDALLRDGLDLKKLAGVSNDDVIAIARLGAAALQSNRAKDAAVVFGALEALDPRDAQHSLHRAYAEAAAGHAAEAVAACDRFLERGETTAKPADVARALLLRAGQRPPSDARLVESDLAAARFVASRDKDARAVVEGRAA